MSLLVERGWRVSASVVLMAASLRWQLLGELLLQLLPAVFPLEALGLAVAEKLEKLRTQEGRCQELLGSILVPRQNEAQGW